ncbi:MAG: hypothetical protein A2939_01685 [Parcubacteria group bacterium RIFCSPLOWO2_01_FULL_48_18]|nr:MAG: hypothetical protein A2939_01685 [Parcubacteria group bacterium RIFCSPLOWO2_01_FULL_48_18]
MNQTTIIHKELAAGRWRAFSLAEQLGNIGSEASRAMRWKNKDEKLFQGAIDRALELFDLTLADPRWRGGRLREIARAREVFCDTFLNDGKEYQSTPQDLDRYFYYFALIARKNSKF